MLGIRFLEANGLGIAVRVWKSLEWSCSYVYEKLMEFCFDGGSINIRACFILSYYKSSRFEYENAKPIQNMRMHN